MTQVELLRGKFLYEVVNQYQGPLRPPEVWDDLTPGQRCGWAEAAKDLKL